jgi:hypothetical protein
MVTVVNASAMDARDFAAALGHLVSTYDIACSNHGTSRARDSGNPVTSSNASPARAADISSARKDSASARVTKVSACERPATNHRT